MSDIRDGNSDAFRDLSSAFLPLQSKSLTGLRLCYLGVSVALASVVRVVNQLIGKVLRPRFPRQMLWVNASEMSLAAGVRGFMLWGWRIAVCRNANETMHSDPRFVDTNPSISIAGLIVRPEQALFFILAWDDYLVKKPTCGLARALPR